MKKTFCVLLAFLMLLPFCPVNSAVASLSDASLAFDGGGLVTLGRPYTVSLGQAAYCSGNGDDLGIKLTDYRFAGAISPQPEEEWVGFDAAGAVFTVEIVIELASAATGLFSFCADFAAYSTNSARPTAQATPCSARESWIRWTTGRSADARIPRPNTSRCAI